MMKGDQIMSRFRAIVLLGGVLVISAVLVLILRLIGDPSGLVENGDGVRTDRQQDAQYRFGWDSNRRASRSKATDGGKIQSVDQLTKELRKLYASGLPVLDMHVRAEVLVKRLVKMVGVAEAIQIVKDIVGSGNDLVHLIGFAFQESFEPLEELIGRLKTNRGDKSYALAFTGLCTRILSRGDRADMIRLLNSEIPFEMFKFIRVPLTLHIGLASDVISADARFSELKGIADEIPASLRDHFLGDLAQAGSTRLPFSAWSLLADIGESTDASKLNNLRAAVAKEMVRENPGRALLLLKESGPACSGLVATGVADWIRSSHNAARSWYESNQGGLSKEVKDSVSLAFLESDLKSGDLTSAKKWLDTIEDSTKRETAMTGLAKVIADRSRQSAPEAAE
jgi:hypothetical protein